MSEPVNWAVVFSAAANFSASLFLIYGAHCNMKTTRLLLEQLGVQQNRNHDAK